MCGTIVLQGAAEERRPRNAGAEIVVAKADSWTWMEIQNELAWSEGDEAEALMMTLSDRLPADLVDKDEEIEIALSDEERRQIVAITGIKVG